MSKGREYLTRRGALLAELEWGRRLDGSYVVEGYRVKRSNWKGWCVIGPTGRFHSAHSFTDALEWITERIDERRGNG